MIVVGNIATLPTTQSTAFCNIAKSKCINNTRLHPVFLQEMDGETREINYLCHISLALYLFQICRGIAFNMH